MEFSTKIFRNNFRFVADRYEEWQYCQCISSGPIDTTITAVVKGDYIHFKLEDKKDLRILSSFSLHCKEPHATLMHDRVQYVQATHDMNPIVPIVCHLFYNGDEINYVRFAMTNPDRLIEFYGTMEELGQFGIPGSDPISTAETADEISEELRQYNCYTPVAITERAEDLLNTITSPDSLEGKKVIVECLKLFVDALKLERKEMQKNEDDDYSFLAVKLLALISLSNLYLGNLNTAYHLARKSLDEYSYAREHSPIQWEGPIDLCRESTMRDIVSYIEENRCDNVDYDMDYDQIDELEVDLTAFKYSCNLQALSYNFNAGDDKEAILKLIDLVRAIGHKRCKEAERRTDHENLTRIMATYNMLENVLLYCWETLGYGNHYDFWEEGDSMFEYMMLSLSSRETLQNVLDWFKNCGDEILVLPSAKSRIMGIIIKTLNRI